MVLYVLEVIKIEVRQSVVRVSPILSSTDMPALTVELTSDGLLADFIY